MFMSFCTKCGTQIPEGSKFCPGCGSPLEEPAKQEEKVTPEVQPEPAKQEEKAAPEVQPEPAEQEEKAASEVKPEPVEPVQQPADSASPAKSEKKKSNLKLWIILGAAAAVLIAFILVFFLAIFPEITARHINMGNYIDTKFGSDYYVDGHIKGELRLNLEDAYKDIVTPEKSISAADFSKFFTNYKSEFKKKSKDDVIVENVAYASMFYDIGDLEKRLGVRFDKDSQAVVKLADEIQKQNITVEEPVEKDFFKYVDKWYYNSGLKRSDVAVDIAEGKIKDDGYSFKTYGFRGEYGSTSCYIYIERGSKAISSIKLEADKSTGKDGNKVKFSLVYTADEDDKNLVYGSPFIVTKTTKTYTIKAEKGLDASQAREYMNHIRKRLRDNYSTGSSYKTNIDGVYLFTARNKNSSTVNMLVSLISKKSKSRFGGAYYVADMMKNCKIDPRAKKSSEKLKYETIDYKYDYKSMNKLWQSVKNKYGNNYTIKKVG